MGLRRGRGYSMTRRRMRWNCRQELRSRMNRMSSAVTTLPRERLGSSICSRVRQSRNWNAPRAPGRVACRSPFRWRLRSTSMLRQSPPLARGIVGPGERGMNGLHDLPGAIVRYSNGNDSEQTPLHSLDSPGGLRSRTDDRGHGKQRRHGDRDWRRQGCAASGPDAGLLGDSRWQWPLSHRRC